MFEWLKNLLFDEEEVVVEEAELNSIDFSRVDNFDSVVTEKTEKEEKEDIIQETKKQSVPIVEKVEVTPRSDLNIQFTSPSKKEETEEYVPKRSERTTIRKDKEIEIQQVLSPMFGGKEVKNVDQIHLEPSPIKKKDGLGTVISPMYGQEELTQHQKQATEKRKTENNEKKILLDEEDWSDDVPLEQLISDDEKNDDCVQFSLFGDSDNLL